MRPLTPRGWPGPEGPNGWAGPAPEREAPPLLWLVNRADPRVRQQMQALRALLTAEELARLGQLRQPEDRERFLLGRGVLRRLLGALLERDPADLVLQTGRHGKPQLAIPVASGRPADTPAPQFNVAHSGELVLLGFHPCRQVGVDVEQRRPVPEWQEIARRCLPPGRHRLILDMPAERRPDAFLLEWCLLEARQKAKGLGLSGRLEGSPASAHPAGTDAASEADAPLQLWRVALPDGYLGAAALA